jgi:hypothetical protein
MLRVVCCPNLHFISLHVYALCLDRFDYEQVLKYLYVVITFSITLFNFNKPVIFVTISQLATSFIPAIALRSYVTCT